MIRGSERIAQMLRECSTSDQPARDVTDRLYRDVYQELRRFAGALIREQAPDYTLRPTELVHEAYLKIVKGSDVGWAGRAHFLAVASKAMRQILVDHARRRAAAKRGGGMQRVTLSNLTNVGRTPELEVLALHDALTRLEENNARMARIVELRAFAGLTAREVAYLLGISKRTVDGDFRLARIWLRREMDGASDTAAT